MSDIVESLSALERATELMRAHLPVISQALSASAKDARIAELERAYAAMKETSTIIQGQRDRAQASIAELEAQLELLRSENAVLKAGITMEILPPRKLFEVVESDAGSSEEHTSEL